MRAQILRIDGITDAERHEMTRRLERAIASSCGSILDFRQFSNVSVCITFEIAPAKLDRLRGALAETRLRLSRESADSLSEAVEAARRGETAGADELSCTLAVTFVHDEPDLRIEVPAVPG